MCNETSVKAVDMQLKFVIKLRELECKGDIAYIIHNSEYVHPMLTQIYIFN